MAGLYYGSKYRMERNFTERNREGAHYIKNIDKWVARVLTKNGNGSTIPGKYNTKKEAEIALNKYKKSSSINNHKWDKLK